VNDLPQFTKMPSSRRKLLIVEDNPADVLFLEHAMREEGLSAYVAVARDGEKAIEYLENSGSEPPDVVIIDINLPKRDGIEVLRKCRFTPSLAETKTLILTSSDESSDHSRADLLGANAYIRKPRDVRGLTDVVRAIRGLLPPEEAVAR
jgi:DNA-binding response OmpR family regulator